MVGGHINYFSCLKIVEILKETEADSKNFFGQYGSKRMKDWTQIIRYLIHIESLAGYPIYYQLHLNRIYDAMNERSLNMLVYISMSTELRGNYVALLIFSLSK